MSEESKGNMITSGKKSWIMKTISQFFLKKPITYENWMQHPV